jgi:hypothetical protein
MPYKDTQINNTIVAIYKKYELICQSLILKKEITNIKTKNIDNLIKWLLV